MLRQRAPRTVGAIGGAIVSEASTAPPSLGSALAGVAGVPNLSRRNLRVTHTPPMMPPPPPINIKYNYAAFAVVLAVFAWAALSPDDDGFNSLLRGAGYVDDRDDDEDDDEPYESPGYDGRDKAMAGGGASS